MISALKLKHKHNRIMLSYRFFTEKCRNHKNLLDWCMNFTFFKSSIVKDFTNQNSYQKHIENRFQDIGTQGESLHRFPNFLRDSKSLLLLFNA